ncbi:hypothetical protein RAS2_19110 [Phycisphaerae bacterium RAS2]|nr:hypothetical protein RAS2_19110 [Phycisphaerae bacterium RAS2]
MLCALTIRSTTGEEPGPPPCGSVPVEGTPVFTGAMGWAKYAFHNPPQTYNPGNPVEVTNGDDYLPGVETPIEGSLRYAINGGGPRLIKVLYNGVIVLRDQLRLENQSHVKITGEYATGIGPTITGSEFLIKDCDNIVLRYMRFRSAYDTNYHCGRTLNIYGSSSGGCNDIIVDHCSIGASRDDNISVSGKLCRVTVQNCIIGGAVMGTSYAGIGSGGENGHEHERLTYCRNLITNTFARQLIFGGSGRVDFFNNVVAVGATHLELCALDGVHGPKINIINNLFRTINIPYWGDRNGLYFEDPIRAKVVENPGTYPFGELPWSTNEDSIYISGNIFMRRDWKNDLWEEPHTSDQWDFTLDANVEDPDPSGEPNFPTDLKRDDAWTMPSGDTIEDAEDVETFVLNDAGCRLPTSQPVLDDYDADLVHAAETGARLFPQATPENNGFPGTPILIAPTDEATGVSTTITLSWTATDETDDYEVFLDTNTIPSTSIGVTSNTQIQASNLQNATLYRWRVEARNSCRISLSAIRAFTTE